MTTTSNNLPNPIRHLQITFNLPIYPRQIKNWRGAFIQMAGWTNELFHNHNNETSSSKNYHHRYPLIHYRIHEGQASILAINEGVDALMHALSENEWIIQWQGTARELKTFESFSLKKYYLGMSPTPKTYRLFNYLALNEDNYHQWQKAPNYIARIQLLQKIITGQLLGYAESMNWQVPQQIKVDIQYIQQIKQVQLHGTPRMAFNLTYSCNVLLPESIALGKGISHGYGWQKTLKVAQPQPAHLSTTKHERIKEKTKA